MNRLFQLLFVLTVLLLSGRVLAQSNAPTTLAGSASAYNQINLSWKDNSTNETKFEIERKDFTTFTKIGEAAVNATTYQDKTVQGSGSYVYRVRAAFATGFSGYSNEITVTTPLEPPGAPTGLAVSLQGSALQVTWSTGSGSTPANFLLERNDNGGAYSQIASVTYSRTPAYTDNIVLTGHQYCYRVRSQNTGGTSGYSNTACFNVPNAATNVRNLKVQALSTSSIKLTWDRYGKESGITIERRQGQTGAWSQIANTLADGGEYTDNGLTANTEYCYRIQESGHDASAVVCATTQAAAPNAPARLAASAVSSSQINLTWADVSDNETGFQVERSTDGGRTFTTAGNPGANSTSYSDGGLSPNTPYCYRVRAVNGAGQSAYTDVQCASTQPLPRPNAPARLAASAVSSSQISLSWADQSDNETGFEIERSPNGNDSWNRINTIPANSTAYSDGGLVASTRYFYRVRAVNANGQSDYTNVADATTQNLPRPNAPVRLTASTASSSQINLSWADQSDNETGFEVERSPNGNDSWSRIATTAANATAYDNNGLTASTRYFYRVRAVNANGQSDYTNVADATTAAPPVTIPAAPVRLAVQVISSSQINLSWGDMSDNETGFEIERASNATALFSKIADVPANTTSYANVGLTANTQYCYRVRAVNSAGQSGFTDVVCGTTQAPPVTVPGAPARLTAQAASSSQISLAWADQSDSETGFEIERSSNGNDGWNRITTTAANATSYPDGSLAASTRYFYRVRAVNGAGQSGYTNVADATTSAPPVAIPAAPVRLAVQVISSSQINLSWGDVSDNETGFEIERASNATALFSKIADVPANTTSYANVGLTANTQYCYRVRAVNSAGQSGFTDVVCGTTQAPPVTVPGAPASLVATAASSSQINLSWADNATNETGFEIERSPNGIDGWSKVGDAAVNATSFSNTGLAASTRYFYRVRAVNSAGQSGYTNVADATTPAPPITIPNAPASLVATAISTSQINLTWADNSNNETGFEVERSPNGTDSWSKIGDAAANATSFSNTGLTPNTRYYYRVRAVNTAGQSAYSNTANATTPSLPVPSTTADLKAEVADYDQIKLTWGAITNNPTGIVIERATSPTGSFTQVGQVSGTTTTFTDVSLPELTTFYYRIRATNANGQSGNSNLASAKTPESIIAVRPQPLPEGIYAHVDHGTLFVTLNWNQFQEAGLRLIGLNGREQLTDQCRINGGTLFQYDVARLPAGIYVLCLDTDKNRFTKKIWIP